MPASKNMANPRTQKGCTKVILLVESNSFRTWWQRDRQMVQTRTTSIQTFLQKHLTICLTSTRQWLWSFSSPRNVSAKDVARALVRESMQHLRPIGMRCTYTLEVPYLDKPFNHHFWHAGTDRSTQTATHMMKQQTRFQAVQLVLPQSMQSVMLSKHSQV